MLWIFNKIDLYRKKNFDDYLEEEVKKDIEAELQENLKNDHEHDNIFLSAVTKENLNDFREMLKAKVLALYEERYPYQARQW